MQPQVVPSDPLATVDDDITALETMQLPVAEQIEIFGRVHHALAAALHGAGAEGAPRPGA